MVLNRGAAPESLDAAASILNRWSIDTPPGLQVRGFTPSFILFTPWTRVEDLEINLRHIGSHGLWNANIERLRIGPGTPAFVRAERDGLIIDGPVRAAAHPKEIRTNASFDSPIARRAICAVRAAGPLAFRAARVLAELWKRVAGAIPPRSIGRVSRAWRIEPPLRAVRMSRSLRRGSACKRLPRVSLDQGARALRRRRPQPRGAWTRRAHRRP